MELFDVIFFMENAYYCLDSNFFNCNYDEGNIKNLILLNYIRLLESACWM